MPRFAPPSAGGAGPLRLQHSAQIADELHAARLAGRAIAPPAELAQLSLREAYEIQDALAAKREAAGGVRSGWKLGLTSAVKQRLMGIDHPLFGRIFVDGAVPNGSAISRSAFIAPRAEPELAVGLAARLEPNADDTGLLSAIAWLAPALEITDSRYLPGTRSAVELVADNTSSAAYVVGAPVPLREAPPLEVITTELVRNETVLAAGSTADVLGNPLTALRLLARQLAHRGLQTVAGDVILSGAITDAFPAAAGDRFAARLRGLATASVTFV